MAAKRVSSKSEDSIDEIFNDFYSKSVDLYKEIDNWSARIDSLLELDIRSADLSFPDFSKFLEFFNFLTGEFNLLYHGKIVEAEGEPILRGYSNDFLKSHLQNIKKQIKKSSKSNKIKETMEAKREEIDLKFGPNGTTLDDGLKLLRSIIKELKMNLPKKFEITMKETRSNTPYASKIFDEKTKEFLLRYKGINFEKELRNHPWRPKPQAPQARKKQKKEVAESSITQKEAAVSTTVTTKSSEKAVQSISSRRRLIVEDEGEDLSQATPAGNVTSSKLQAVGFLSGLGSLHLREELYKELTSNVELGRCVFNKEKQRCINIVEKYISSVINKDFVLLRISCGHYVSTTVVAVFWMQIWRKPE